MSPAGCPKDGGGVCPSDAAGLKADFTNLTGDDIRALAGKRVTFNVHDVYAAQDMTVSFPPGEIAFYGELRTHIGATNLSASIDVWHGEDAESYCHAVVADAPTNAQGKPALAWVGTYAADAIQKGAVTGGATGSDGVVRSLYMGSIGNAIKTGSDTGPEIFVGGITSYGTDSHNVDANTDRSREWYWDGSGTASTHGARYPANLVFVNGPRSAAIGWSIARDGTEERRDLNKQPWALSIGDWIPRQTSWNLSDAYYVNNWPGTPYTAHKASVSGAYPFVTQVNYITGYFCAASLQ
ncbi:hypothetical protein LJZ39_004786 [Salmonella enterica]|nr:hypothetical protein [Salmonella enterica]